MDLIRNSGLDPVAHGLGVQLQPLGDLRHRKKLIWDTLRLTEAKDELCVLAQSRSDCL
jgi:hypothetical protein